MSDYSFYEFAVVDQPLTPTQREALRGISSRAHISAFGFTDTYHRRNLTAEPSDLLARYFDALVHSSDTNEGGLALRFLKSQITQRHPPPLRAYAMPERLQLLFVQLHTSHGGSFPQIGWRRAEHTEVKGHFAA